MVLHSALKGKNGRVLKKHHRQSAHQAIVQRIIDFGSLTAIIDLLEEFGDCTSQCAEAEMFFDVQDTPLYWVFCLKP